MLKQKIRNGKEIPNSIMRGLNEALEFSHNMEKSKLRTKKVNLLPIPEYKATDIKRIRKKLLLTQKNLAYALGVSIKTVESWESDINVPSGPAQRFLYLLNKRPQLLKEIES